MGPGDRSASGIPTLGQRGTTPASTGLYILPSGDRLTVARGSAVEICVDNVTDLYAVHLSIEFDPTKLQVKDNDPTREGVQIAPGSLPMPDFVVVNRTDNQHGTIEYAVTQLNPRAPAQGSGVVATIHFQGIDQGTSPLRFLHSQLARPDGQAVPVQAMNNSLEIDRSDTTRGASRGLAQAQD